MVIEQTSKNAEEDLDWEKLLPINTIKDLFATLSANDIRSLRDMNPNVR